MATKVLVTGGAGFIGSHTVDLLLQRGYAVRVLDALAAPVHEAGRVPDYVPLQSIEFLRGDVRVKADLERALDGVDAVIHLAAYQDYLPDFSKFFHVNGVGTALIYEIIVEQRLPIRKVVVASSQAIYGEGKYVCAEHGVCYPDIRPEARLQAGVWGHACPQCGAALTPDWTDEAVVNPFNQYALSKQMEETIALKLGRRYDIPSVGMRYSIVQGPRQSFRNAYSGVLRIFATRYLTGQAPVAYEDGQQLRDYVNVGDVARANVLVLETPAADYRAFNVGGGHRMTVLEFGRLMAERAGTALRPSVPGTYRFGDTRHIFSDIRALRALGWAPQVSVRESIDQYLAWARTQPGLADFYERAQAEMLKVGTLRVAAAA